MIMRTRNGEFENHSPKEERRGLVSSMIREARITVARGGERQARPVWVRSSRTRR